MIIIFFYLCAAIHSTLGVVRHYNLLFVIISSDNHYKLSRLLFCKFSRHYFSNIISRKINNTAVNNTTRPLYMLTSLSIILTSLRKTRDMKKKNIKNKIKRSLRSYEHCSGAD